MVAAPLFNRRFSPREQLALLEAYYDVIDWPLRCAHIAKRFPAEMKSVFTPRSCKKEFERLMAEPCPGHTPSLNSSQTPYSRKFVIDQWKKHLQNIIDEEDAKADELELVEIRKNFALVERLLGNKRPIPEEEVQRMLEHAREEDAKRDDQDAVVRSVRAYMIRLEEVFKDGLPQVDASDMLLPATRRADHSPRGVDTAFRSPSPGSRSPIKSPIRSVKETLREAESVGSDDVKSEAGTVSRTPSESGGKAKMSPKKTAVAEKTVASGVEKSEEPSTPVAEPKRRGRGRPPRVSMVHDDSTGEDAKKDEKVPEKSSRRSREHKDIKEDKEESNTKAKDRKEREEEESEDHAGSEARRASRRQTASVSATSPPAMSAPPTRKRARVVEDDEPEPERKRERRISAKKESSVMSDASFVTTASTTTIATTVNSTPMTREVQTDVSIQTVGMRPPSSSSSASLQSPKDRERRSSVSSRKSSRRSDVDEGSMSSSMVEGHCESGTQTTRIEFEPDEKVIVRYNPDEEFFEPTRKEDGWSDDDDVALSKFTKKQSASSIEDEMKCDEEMSERHTRHEKREINVVYDTEDWLAEAMVDQLSGYQFDGVRPTTLSSPTKRRAGRDEKSKEEFINTKSSLLDCLRSVHQHKHSGIFSQPVSEKEARGYTTAVKQRVDLSTLRKQIENDVITTPLVLKNKLLLMFANAVMFNSTGHDVNLFALEMANETIDEIFRLGQFERRAGLHPRRSKVPDELTRPRSTIRSMPISSLAIETSSSGRKGGSGRRERGGDTRRK